MVQLIGKNSKRRYGLNPGYTPQLKNEKTEEATIPMIQPDGSIKYASVEDLKWMADNGLADTSYSSRQ